MTLPFPNKCRQTDAVIPARAGIQDVKSQETVLSDKFPCRQGWIPARAQVSEAILLAEGQKSAVT
ncbi:hypothetical protein EPM72_12220, partial [Neisseria gonorrhoeae]